MKTTLRIASLALLLAAFVYFLYAYRNAQPDKKSAAKVNLIMSRFSLAFFTALDFVNLP